MNIVFHIAWGIGDFKAFILFPAMTKSAMMQDLLNTCLLRHCQEKIADRLATVKIVKSFVLCNVLPKGRFGTFEKGYAPGLQCDGTFHVIPCFKTLHRVCWMFLPRYLCNQQPIWKRFLEVWILQISHRAYAREELIGWVQENSTCPMERYIPVAHTRPKPVQVWFVLVSRM